MRFSKKKKPQPKVPADRSDTFCDAWGGYTKWKSGSDVNYPDPETSDPTRTIASRSTSIPKTPRTPDLSKPLPPLPPRLASCRPTPTRNVSELSTRTSVPSSISNKSDRGYFTSRRKSLFWPIGRQTKEKVEQPIAKTQIAFEPAPPACIDQGTQTISPGNDAESAKTVIRRSPESHQKDRKESPGPEKILKNQRPASIKSTSPPVSPLKEHPSNPSTPHDYFGLPTKDWIRREYLTRKRMLSNSPDSHELLTHERPKPPQRQVTDSKSADSGRTYGSGSLRVDEEESRKVRPPIFTRIKVSDSVLPTMSKLDSELRDIPRPASPISVPLGVYHHEPQIPALLRDLPIIRPAYHLPWQAVSTPKSPHSRRISSDRSNGSPLREGYKDKSGSEAAVPKLDEQPKDFFDPKWYRVKVPEDRSDSGSPLRTRESPPAIDWTIPDHLKSSPLCPLNPKHPLGGIGPCPQHGGGRITLNRNDRTLFLDSSEDSQDGEPARTPGSPMTPGTPTIAPFLNNRVQPKTRPVRVLVRKDTPDTIAEETANFKLDVLKHSADSPFCPARQPGGKGVCVLHGRDKGEKVAEGPRVGEIARALRSE